MKPIKFGLLIQGPVSSFGNGPNNSKEGFATEGVIRQNVQAFTPFIDSIVLSTWEDSGLDDQEFLSKCKLLENKPVLGFDFLNQRKQFVTTSSGVKWLKESTGCTHVLKIRTDQLVPPELISWLKDFYEKSQFNESNQEDFLFFSEALRSESFYAGDFIFAGTIGDMSRFCDAVLSTQGMVHPMNASDYVLKWLQTMDPKFLRGRSPLVRSLLTAKNSLATQSLWLEALDRRIALPPKEIYKRILWRGRSMPEVLESSIDSHFIFNEDMPTIAANNREVHSIGKTYRVWREYWRRYLEAKHNFSQSGGK